jgi:WD40 repeat protein
VYFPCPPQGPYLATWSHIHDRTIRLWDAITGLPVGAPMPHERDPRPFAFLTDAPGGPRILSVDEGRAIRVWDAERQTLVGESMADGSVRQAAYVPDGPHGPCILSWSLDGSVRLWDAVTHRPRVPPMKHEGVVFEAVCITDAAGGPKILSWSTDGTARLWHAEDGAPVGEPMRHKGRVSSASYLPSTKVGPCIVTGSDEDATVRLWHAENAMPVRDPMRHDCPRRLWTMPSEARPYSSTATEVVLRV